MKTITATAVPEAARNTFLPSKLDVPELYLRFEMQVFNQMGAMAKGYYGGYWEFYDLSNGSFYIAFASDERFRISIESNGFEAEVSADAAGIIASLFSLNLLCWWQPSAKLNHLYYGLRDFAAQHPEAAAIYGAID